MLYGDGLEPYGFSFFTAVKISTTIWNEINALSLARVGGRVWCCRCDSRSRGLCRIKLTKIDSKNEKDFKNELVRAQGCPTSKQSERAFLPSGEFIVIV